jgi:hypothetical protein
MNEYNNPSFATMFQRALLNTCIAQQDALTQYKEYHYICTKWQDSDLKKKKNLWSKVPDWARHQDILTDRQL